MEINSEKKISIGLIISSICILFYGYIAKEYDPYENNYIVHLIESGIDVPISYYHVKLLGIEMPYLPLVLISLILLALGVFWIFYKTDKEIKILLKKIWSTLLTYSFSLSSSIKGNSFIKAFKKNRLYSFYSPSKNVNNIQAKKIIKTEKFWSDKGRLRRNAYAIRVGVIILILVIVSQVDYNYFDVNSFYVVLVLRVVVGLVCLFTFFMQSIKRLQDIGKNGWWFVLFFIPFINILFLIYVLFVDGSVGVNKYGDDPKGRTITE